MKFFKNNQTRGSRYVIYTGLFCVLFLLAFCWFYIGGRSFVWAGMASDGLVQHYNFLAYFGEWMRGILKTLFHTGHLEIPMFDFAIGQGGDVITNFSYYVMGDPLCLLSVFFKASQTELLYNFLVVLRLYLAGMAFLVYTRKMECQDMPSVCGALIYVFSAYALNASVRHPYFINPMIYLPVLLVGIEKIFRKESPCLFIFMTFVSAASNFYFFYMLSVLMLLYAAFRYRSVIKYERLRRFPSVFFPFCGYYLVGIGIAAVLFLPAVVGILSSGRMDAKALPELFYGKSYYQAFLPAFAGAYGSMGSWTYFGYTAVGLGAVVCLFCRKEKRYRPLQAGFLFLTLCLLLPAAGFVFNGFAYVSNRWVWGYSLLSAYVTAVMLPRMKQITKRELTALLTVTVLFLGILVWKKRLCIYVNVITAFLFVLLLIFLFVFSKERKRRPSRRGLDKIFQGVILGMICLGIVLSGHYVYSPEGSNYVSEFIRRGEAEKRFEDTPADMVKSLEEPEFYRYEENSYEQPYVENAALRKGISTTWGFYSMANGFQAQMYANLQGNNFYTTRYMGFDGRVMPDALASVKYFSVPKGMKQYVPFGYQKVLEKELENPAYGSGGKRIYEVYENAYALPLGYTYTTWFDEAAYERMNVTRRQQALLQSVLLEEGKEEQKNSSFVYSEKKIPCSIKNEKGIELSRNKVKARRSGTCLTVEFEGMESCETYVLFKNLKYIPKMELGSQVSVSVKSRNVKKRFFLSTPDYVYYMGKRDFMVNLGYDQKAKRRAVIQFPGPGVYTFDDIEIVCQPMEGYEESVEKLKEDVLEKVQVKTNQVCGTIDLDQSKILCLSIPFSDGWTAKVDGKKAKLLRANTMYMALPLEKGTHTIELTYCTPGIKAGLAVTVGSLLIFLLLLTKGKKHLTNTFHSNRIADGTGIRM